MKQKDDVALGYIYAAKEAVRLSGLEGLKVVGGKSTTGHWVSIDVYNRDKHGLGWVYVRHPVNAPILIQGSRVKSVHTRGAAIGFVCKESKMTYTASSIHGFWRLQPLNDLGGMFTVELCDPKSLSDLAVFIRERFV